MYNQLLQLYRSTNDPYVRHKANLLLDQYNTAGGPELLRKEIQVFLAEHEDDLNPAETP